MPRKALVVSVSQYGKLDLGNFPSFANNANAIASVLRPTFTVTCLPEEGVQEGERVQVGKESVSLKTLQEQLKSLFTASDFDTVLFYFSGHGLLGKQPYPKTYLATSESEVSDDGYRKAIEIDLIKSFLRDCPAREQIVWLDCCYGGDLASFTEVCDRNDGKTRFIITASRSQDPAYEEIAGEMGVFTRVLVEALARTGATERRITCAAIEDVVREKLQSLHYPQMPQFYRTPNKIINFWERIVPVTHGNLISNKSNDGNEANERKFIDRPKIEQKLNKQILEERALIRISAAHKMGKTWLLNKGLSYAQTQGFQTVAFRYTEEEQLGMVDNFLKSFCLHIFNRLELSFSFNEYWDTSISAQAMTAKFLEKRVLPKIRKGLVIAIDNFDFLFKAIFFDDFCKLIRSLNEEAGYNKSNKPNQWKKLRIVIAFSTKRLLDLSGTSPLYNIGTCIELEKFTDLEVETLFNYYSLQGSLEEDSLKKIMALVDNHPYLINLAFDYLKENGVNNKSIHDILYLSHTREGTVFRYHLRNLQKTLEKYQLKDEYKKILNNCEVSDESGEKLECLGIARCVGNLFVPTCNLYLHYFLNTL
jgi:hypothetical protein